METALVVSMESLKPYVLVVSVLFQAAGLYLVGQETTVETPPIQASL